MSHPPGGLELADITKHFGATRALNGAWLDVARGEIHTLLGENGSGKSTMVKIIGGVHRPDAGSFTLDGRGVTLRSPRQSAENGIAVVFQEVLTAPSQSVLDNIWLGADGVFTRRTPRTEQRARAASTLARLVEDIDLDAPAGELSLSDRQALCIARALVREPSVLVLDESTAALDVRTRDRLFVEMRRLASSGVSILFISHRMDEVAEISDRVTVLRSGRTVSTTTREEMTIPGLIADMTGEADHGRREMGRRSLGAVTLTATGITLAPGGGSIDFEIRAGELVGLAGLEGHGQDAFLKRLAGVATGSGNIETFDPDSDRPTSREDVAYLPRERRGESLFESMSILENFALPTLALDTRGGIIDKGRTSRRFSEFVEALSIRLGTSHDAISTLSGGSQQKVLLARWLATAPRVLLLNDPTRGVDIMTKREIYATLDKLCSAGMSVIMLSSEVEELVELVDRVLVFRDMSVFAEISGDDVATESIVAAYFGQEIGRAA